MSYLTPDQKKLQDLNGMIIKKLLAGKSVTFAQINYSTQVATAAANRARNILKHTTANVQLFSDIKAATSVFENAVKRSAAKVPNNDAVDVSAFTAQSNFYEHSPDCFSIVKHRTEDKFYLYALFNHADSVYTIDGTVSTVEEVARYLTASAARELLNPKSTVQNATYGIEHTVICRVIGLHNITQINAVGQKVSL